MKYDVPCQSFNENNEEKLNKYIIRLGEYHRLVLRSEIYADEPPKSLYREVSKQPCDLNIIYFPEFQNYHLYNWETIVPGKTYSIGGKIWNATKATAGIMGAAAGLAYKVGKPAVCFLGGAAYKGVKYVGNSIWNHYKGTDNNNKINSNINNNNFDKKNINFNNNNMNRNNSNGNQNLNGFALVDYSDEDLCQIKTVDLNSPKDKGNMNINYNININNNIDMKNMKIKMNNNGIINSQMGNLNNHNNIIANDNYLLNIGNDFQNININNNTFDNNSSKNINIININNKSDFDGFEILSQDKEHSVSSNSFFENNSFAGMNVQFENTDKVKARQDANNFLLKP